MANYFVMVMIVKGLEWSTTFKSHTEGRSSVESSPKAS